MTMQRLTADMIKELEAEIDRLKKVIKNCPHDWTLPIYDPETVKEPVYSHLEGHGSDPYPVYNYVDRKKDRWSRTCKTCGHKEYTYKQGPVEPVKIEPKF